MRACQTYEADGTVLFTTDGFTDLQVDGAANGVFSFHDKHYPVFQQTKDQYLKAVEERFASLKENGIGGSVGQATDAAKQLPGYVNKQTEVALDRVEDAFNRVTSLPIGETAPVQICLGQYCVSSTGHVASLHCTRPFMHSNLLPQLVMVRLTYSVACSAKSVGTGEAHSRLCMEAVLWHPQPHCGKSFADILASASCQDLPACQAGYSHVSVVDVLQ